jgi:hypothetical protein
MEAHHIVADNAADLVLVPGAGGIALWRSANSATRGSWTAPPCGLTVVPGKPTWEADDQPARTITDPAEVIVDTPVEVRRFHVAVRRGSQGLSLKLTDGATRRVHAACAKAGDGAWYSFDYATQEAVVWRAGESVPLPEFVGAVAAR